MYMYHKTQIFALQQSLRSINEPLTSLSSFIYTMYVLCTNLFFRLPYHSRATTLKHVHETHIFFLQQSPRSINEPLMSLRSINEPLMSLSSTFIYVPICFRLSCYSTQHINMYMKNLPLLLTHCFVDCYFG